MTRLVLQVYYFLELQLIVMVKFVYGSFYVSIVSLGDS